MRGSSGVIISDREWFAEVSREHHIRCDYTGALFGLALALILASREDYESEHGEEEGCGPD